MIEYPSIINSSKAPRANCVAFDKLDGSNFRAKWTNKRGFHLYGSRTQLIDTSTPILGEAVSIFINTVKEPLEKVFRKEYPNVREIVVFGEFLGENSFAGIHFNEPHKFVLFDVLVGHKNEFFVKPYDFIKTFGEIVETPRVVYCGNLNDQFIQDVRENKFGLKEGVICKGTVTHGAYRGKQWMCKIKTQEYLNKLKNKFGDEWEKYGE
jgi:hypothetical protein